MKVGGVYSSCGVTAGIDLALYLVKEDWWHDLTTTTARGMVTFPSRPGGQTQYSKLLLGNKTASQDFRMLQEWINANPLEDLSIDALAERMCMSPRNITRRFDQEVGITPAKFVENSRLAQIRIKN